MHLCSDRKKEKQFHCKYYGFMNGLDTRLHVVEHVRVLPNERERESSGGGGNENELREEKNEHRKCFVLVCE